MLPSKVGRCTISNLLIKKLGAKVATMRKNHTLIILLLCFCQYSFAECSIDDRVVLAKQGYKKSEIEKMCNAKKNSEPQVSDERQTKSNTASEMVGTTWKCTIDHNPNLAYSMLTFLPDGRVERNSYMTWDASGKNVHWISQGSYGKGEFTGKLSNRSFFSGSQVYVRNDGSSVTTEYECKLQE
jgi:hypothetical protein